MTIKRGRKLRNKPDPEYAIDSEEETARTPKHGKAKGAKMENKAMQASKSTKANVRKPVKTEEPSDESDSEEKVFTQQKTRGNTKKLRMPKLAQESSDVSGSEDDSKPVKKVKAKKRVIRKQEPAEASSDDSDADTEQSQSMKSPLARGKRSNKPAEAAQASSETGIEPMVPTDVKEKAKIEDTSDDELSSDIEQDNEAQFNPKKHKENLDQLKRIDPDFYEFLKNHDTELLEFDEDGLEDNDDDDDIKDEKKHVPGELHGESDESDFEDGEAPVKGNVTLLMVKDLEAQLRAQSKIKVSTFTHMVKVFSAAVQRAASEDGATDSEYNVTGSAVFNAVLNMCVLHFPPAIKRYLGATAANTVPKNCKHFVKVKGILIQYLTDLLKLLPTVNSSNIQKTLLKHLHQMSRFVACFTRIAKRAIKRLLPLWSTGEETIQVLSFVCILRITRNQQLALLTPVLKTMFMMYVKNCKFVSPTTWPGITFMRRSLVEMYSLDMNVSYPLVFLYVRQLGIHLRNAIVVPKLEHRLAVYNWQYINSLHLWAELLQHSRKNPEMWSLFYPVTMIVSYTIKLVPTAQYYPVRFYLIEVLMNMTMKGKIFVPVLGFFLDVISKFDFNKKHTKVSMKPLDFSCVIRLSKSQMSENGFKDTVMDKLYALLLEFMAFWSTSISFPDIVVIVILKLKKQIGKCTVPNYAKKLKQLTDKIEESSQHICNVRLTNIVSMTDYSELLGWEAARKAEGTPLTRYYESWAKLNNIHKRKLVTKNDELAGQLPSIKRAKLPEQEYVSLKVTKLFASDSDDEVNDFLNKAVVVKYQRKRPPKANPGDANVADPGDANVADPGDDVKEFKAKDW